MNFTVLTACTYPDTRPIHYILDSARHFGIKVVPFGIGGGYAGWFDIKIKRLLAALREVRTSHVLYTDGNDALFVRPMVAILAGYKLYGSPPMLCCGSRQALNDTWMHTNYYAEAITHYPDAPTPYKYPHAGGFMGETEVVRNLFERLMAWEVKWGDDAQVWHEAWAAGWFRPTIDHHCLVFQATCRGAALDDLEVREGSLYNLVTDTYPCIFHYNGGYSDPVTGKEDRIEPWRTRLEGL